MQEQWVRLPRPTNLFGCLSWSTDIGAIPSWVKSSVNAVSNCPECFTSSNFLRSRATSCRSMVVLEPALRSSASPLQPVTGDAIAPAKTKHPTRDRLAMAETCLVTGAVAMARHDTHHLGCPLTNGFRTDAVTVNRT